MITISTAAIALGGCGDVKQAAPEEPAKARAEAKRRQAACASSAAYDRLEAILFDRAIGERRGDRAGLDSLADYSLARMEQPVVKAWDPELEITRCQGRFILDLPPGAERGFNGERRLSAVVDYSAQTAADRNGLVYRLTGGETIVARLAAFDLRAGSYRPPPAIDEQQAGAAVPEQSRTAGAEVQAPTPPHVAARADGAPPARPGPERSRRPSQAAADAGGEATVLAFYSALGAGDGAAASARIVPEKRSSRAFSPEAMSRFYGRLPEPIGLTAITPFAGGAYRVSYRYAAGRSRGDGSAIVRLTRREGRELIRSIQALDGC